MEVTVQEAKTQLSRVRCVGAGEAEVIRWGREPVAVLTRVLHRCEQRPIWGDLVGDVTAEFDEVPDDFASFA